VFVLYVLFLLVGPTPLQDGEPGDVTASNYVNQIVDSVLPAVALLCLVPHRTRLFRLAIREKYLTMFLAWSLLTVVWSDFPLSSVKAGVRLIGSTLVIVSFLSNTESSNEAIPYLKRIFAIYIPVSFLVIAFVPYGIQWEWPAWRGIADGKNTLGQVAVISAFVWTVAYFRSAGRQRVSTALFLGGSVVLLLGSKSTTALIAFLTLCAMGGSVVVERRMQRLGIARPAPILIGASVAVVLLLAYAFELSAATMVFGKDDTFTGRTDIWTEMIDAASTHPYRGGGYSGFWIPENPDVQRLWQDDKFPWRPNEGHQGYLDIWNETGFVGLSLLGLMVASYYKRLAMLRRPHVWHWPFLAVLVFNLTESTIFKVGQFSGWIFLFSYLALQADLLQAASTRQVSGKV
jgi:O-antigen ligase